MSSLEPRREGTATSRREGIRAVLALAWPAILSYLLNNFHRINDQFWTEGLGAGAKGAISAAMYVAILCFAVYFLAGAGALSLVSRATGARDPALRDSYVRHALLLAVVLGGAVSVLGGLATDGIVSLLDLQPVVAPEARAYLSTMFAVAVPMALAPTIDHVFIARGNSVIPMLLQSLAISVNWILNPVLIFGAGAGAARDVPTAALSGALADWLVGGGLVPAAGLGVGGAALATGLSRTVSSLVGLLVLRFGFELHPFGRGRPRLARLAALVRVSAPVSLSIAVYATVYGALTSFVLSKLAPAVLAGLGVGFQVFEGLAFPCFIGIASATASLVGRYLGSGDVAGARCIVSSARRVGLAFGIAATTGFVTLVHVMAPWFADDPAVLAETERYVLVLAFSQVFVAVESVNEKVLMGAGLTRPILFISTFGNVLRIPLAWLLALGLGFGAAGVWWAINLTTYAKAFLLWREVEKGAWEHARAPGPPPSPATEASLE